MVLENADGSVIIKVNLDVSEAEKDVKSLTDEITEVEKKTKETGGNDQLSKSLETAKEQAGELLQTLAEVNAEQAKGAVQKPQYDYYSAASRYIEEYSRGVEQATASENEMQRALQEVEAELKTLENAGQWFGDAEYDQAYQKLQKIRGEVAQYRRDLQSEPRESVLLQTARDAQVSDQRIVNLNEELRVTKLRLRELKDAGVGLGHKEYDELTSKITSINNELTVYQKNLTNIGNDDSASKISSSFDSVLASVSKAASATGFVFPSLVNVGKGLIMLGRNAARAFGKTLSVIRSLGAGLAKFARNFNIVFRLFDTFAKKLKRIPRLIRNVFFFSVITRGLRALRTMLTSYFSTTEELMTSLSRLKGALLTAFQPIYDYVVPALTRLLNALTPVIANISQLVASLFGTTAKQAQEDAEALYEQSKALDATSESAQNAQEALAGYDEINKIQTETASSSAAAETENKPLFDYEYDDTMFKTWGEAFDAFLDNILNNGIPKLQQGLSNFAKKVNKFSNKLYEMFTFPRVGEKIERLGRQLGKSLNNLIDEIEWGDLGKALGAGANSIVTFLVAFIYRADWKKIGKSIGELINNAVKEISWYDVGALLWGGIKMAIDFVAGLILGSDPVALANAASKLVIGFFNSMRLTLDGIEWEEIGEKIRIFLTSLDWAGIWESVSGAIKSAMKASSEFFSGLLGEELKNTITDILEIVATASLVLGAILLFTGVNPGLGVALISLGAAALAAEAFLDWEKFSSDFKSIITKMLAIVGEITLLIGLILVFTGVNIALGVGLIAVAAASMVGVIALNWNAIVEAMRGPIGKIIAIVSAALLVLGIILVCTGVALPLGIALIAAGAIGLVSYTALNWNAILEKLKGVWESIKNWWNTKVAKFFTLDYWKGLGKDIMEGLWSGLKSIWESISKWISEKTKWISDAWNGVKKFFGFGGDDSKASTYAISATYPVIDIGRIPALARGTVVPPNREFLARLGDNTTETEVVSPLSTMKQAFLEALQESGGTGNRTPIQVSLNVDGKTLAKVLVPNINDMSRSAGHSVLLV